MCVRKVCVALSSVERGTVLRQASITDSRGSTRDDFYVWLKFSIFHLHPLDLFFLLCLLNWYFNSGAWHNVACALYLLWWGIFCLMFYEGWEVLRTEEKYLCQLRGFKMAEGQPVNSCQANPATNVGFVWPTNSFEQARPYITVFVLSIFLLHSIDVTLKVNHISFHQTPKINNPHIRKFKSIIFSKVYLAKAEEKYSHQKIWRILQTIW